MHELVLVGVPGCGHAGSQYRVPGFAGFGRFLAMIGEGSVGVGMLDVGVGTTACTACI